MLAVLDFTSGFDASPPTSRRIYGKQISSKVFWFTLDGRFEIRSLSWPPLSGLKQTRGFGWAWFRLGDLGAAVDGCGWNKVHGVGWSCGKPRQMMCVHRAWWTHKVSVLQSQAPWGCSNCNGDNDTQSTSEWAIMWRRNYFLCKNWPTYYVCFSHY